MIDNHRIEHTVVRNTDRSLHATFLVRFPYMDEGIPWVACVAMFEGDNCFVHLHEHVLTPKHVAAMGSAVAMAMTWLVEQAEQAAA